MKTDIYQETTNRIIAALEAGTIPWLRPWRDNKSGSALEPYNAVTGRQYNGVNLLILGCTHYSSLAWLTYKQAQSLGGNVRKGERGTPIVFWSFNKVKDEATGKTKTIPFARGYTVFNVAQCENLDQSKLKMPTPPIAGETTINKLAFSVGAVVHHGGNRAYYTTAGDYIQIPSADAFKTSQHYEATLAHELTHWTGHKSRCNRQFGARFGNQEYAFEELVAEIGAAFLGARFGILQDGLQHADYIGSWLEVLKNDKRAIFTAASKARQALSFLAAEPQEEEEAIAA